MDHERDVSLGLGSRALLFLEKIQKMPISRYQSDLTKEIGEMNSKSLNTFAGVTLSTWTLSFAMSQTLMAGPSQGQAQEIPKDVFYQAGSNSTAVEFDCAPKTSTSPYCLIRILDPVKQVVCYGLVSSEKVVNPAISCVPMANMRRLPTSAEPTEK